MSSSEASDLRNARVLLTRPKEKSEALRDRLVVRGATVSCVPLIEISGVRSDLCDALLEQVSFYDWVLVTSASAVTHFLARTSKPERTRVAAVGQASAEAATAAGWEPTFMGDGSSGLAMVRALDEQYALRGHRVLYPCSALAPDGLTEVVNAMGVTEFNAVPVYENHIPVGLDTALLAAQDVAVFYSPSAVQNYLHAMGVAQVLGGLGTVAVGATTEGALVAAGAHRPFKSETPGLDHMVAATVACWQQRNKGDA